MRWGAKDWRSSVSRYLPALVAAGVAGAAELSTHAMADILQLRPIFGIEQIFTDNVRASSTDQDADAVTVLNARLEAAVRSTRITAVAEIDLFYNEFWATDDLDNFNGAGIAVGRAEVLDNLFFIDAAAQKQDVYLSPNDISASGLTTGQGSIQQKSYSVSPFIQADVFGMADLLIRANYAQVIFDRPVVGVAAIELTDVTVKQLGARIDTGQRSSLYQIVATAEHLETDQGFEQENVIGGLFFNFTKRLAAIGRIGYERITDPTIAPIRGTIWSAGGRYRIADDSLVQVEYGRRFGDNTYLAEINLALTPRLNVVGGYTDTLVPVQLTLVRSITDLFDQDGNINVATPNAPSIPDPTIVDAIVRDKEVRMAAVVQDDLQTYTLTFGHNDRFYPTLVDNEKYFVVDFTIEEQLSRRLSYYVHAQYQDNYEVLVTRNTSQIYRTELTLLYQYTEAVAFGGGYAWRYETSPVDPDTQENILRFSVQQAF
jgi:uncharacterized protein (PEP-CTERM system associated)